eukprot:5470218-Amphidinium_carterae.1
MLMETTPKNAIFEASKICHRVTENAGSKLSLHDYVFKSKHSLCKQGGLLEGPNPFEYPVFLYSGLASPRGLVSTK